VDYVAVPNNDLIKNIESPHTMFGILEEYLRLEKYELFLVTPNCFTIRARFPQSHKYQGVADFVMARKEVGYIPGTRTPIIKPGTLFDDLERRDFTLNALAKDDKGNIIDFFDGQNHLRKGVLRTPLDPEVTFNDDPLRILRAIRFCISKSFFIETKIDELIRDYDYKEKMVVVSDERIREELYKCFKHDTIETLRVLHEYPKLRNYVFRDNKLWLKPTFEL
jgi:tRNA nucleotidyltransferase/poly(A) polymerase